MGEKRDAYVAKMVNKLRKWSTEIERMDAGARELDVGRKQDFQQKIEDLKAKRKDINFKIEGVRRAGETGWKSMKPEVDSSWKALDRAIHSAMETYKESSLPGEF